MAVAGTVGGAFPFGVAGAWLVAVPRSIGVGVPRKRGVALVLAVGVDWAVTGADPITRIVDVAATNRTRLSSTVISKRNS